jgi:flavin-dependent dehydrogenase
VTLFERDTVREKPCGGGLTPRVFSVAPELLHLDLPWREVFTFKLVGPSGGHATLYLPEPIRIIDRHTLDSSLRQRAVSAGVRLVVERVHYINRWSGGVWQINGHFVDVVVGAGGVNDPLARVLGLGWQPHQRALTFGYTIPGHYAAAGIICRFFQGVKGYAWWFPRRNNASIGIEFFDGRTSWPRARALLKRFAANQLPEATIADGRPFACTEPMPGRTALLKRPCCGQDWALVGDAAGLVDALTGEGLPYAFQSGRLAATAIARGHLRQYGRKLRATILSELAATYRLSGIYYHRSLIDWHLAVTSRSRRQQGLVCDFALGYKSYRRYWREVLEHLPAIGVEFFSAMRRHTY